MALRFLARHGSRLARRGREEGRLARPWSSVSRSKHTVPQEIVAAGLPNSAHDGSILIRRSAFAEFSEACKSPHQMNPAFSTFTLRRCAFKEACQANPPSFNGSCRGFGSFTTDALSHFKGNAAIVLPQKTLFRRISTEAITKKLKLSPSTIKKPIDELMKTASRYKDVAGLQVEGFWKRNVMILVGAAGILACFLLWQIMYGVANLFVSFSEGMAKFGFLGMAAATVAFAVSASYFLSRCVHVYKDCSDTFSLTLKEEESSAASDSVELD